MSLFQYVETREFQVENPIFRVGTNVDNTYTDTQDIGLFGQYYDGANLCYTGLFRDANDSGKYKLFKGLQDLPVVADGSALVNTAGTGYALANLDIQDLHAFGSTVIEGDLTVNGTMTTVNVNTLSVEDNIIIANSGPANQKEDAGFVVRRVAANVASADAIKQSGTASASGTTTTVELQAANGHGTTLNYYKGWVVKFGGDVTGTAIVTSSTAADPPVLTFDTAASGATTTSSTYELFNKQFAGWVYDESTDYATFYGFPREDLEAVIDPAGDAGNGNLADYVNLRVNDMDAKNNITSTGSIASGTSVSATTSMSAGTTITSVGNISSTTGSVSAFTTLSAGTSISAGSTISAVGNITSSTGDLVSTLGNVLANQSITATNGAITALNGNIVASVGNISATTGNVTAGGSVSATTTVTAGTSISATNNITTTAGDLVASNGNLNIVNGNATIGGNLTVSGSILAPLNIDDNIISVNAGPNVLAEDFGYVGKRTAVNVAAQDAPKIDLVAVQTNYTALSTTLLITNAASGTNYFKGWVVTNTVDGLSVARTVNSSTNVSTTHTLILDSGFTSALTAGTDTVKLYNKHYAGWIYDESTDTINMVGFPREIGETKIDPIAPVNGNIPDYINMAVNNLAVGGTFSFTGSISHHTKVQVASITFTQTDMFDHDIIYLNPTGGNTTYTLPQISSLVIPANQSYIVLFVNIHPTNTATLARSGSDTIEGATTLKFAKQWMKSCIVLSDGIGTTYMIKG